MLNAIFQNSFLNKGLVCIHGQGKRGEGDVPYLKSASQKQKLLIAE